MTKIMWIIVINSLIGLFIALPILYWSVRRLVFKERIEKVGRLITDADQKTDAIDEEMTEIYDLVSDAIELRYGFLEKGLAINTIISVILWEYYMPKSYIILRHYYRNQSH